GFRVVTRLWVLVFLFAAACTDRDNAGTEASEPQRGGIAVIVSGSDLRDLNPLIAGEKYSQEVNRFMLFLPLIRHAPDLSFEPALAENWEMLGDTGVVFQLRRDVYWHDGVQTTAHDVAFT